VTARRTSSVKLTTNMEQALLNIAKSIYCSSPHSTPPEGTLNALERRGLVGVSGSGWWQVLPAGAFRVIQIESDIRAALIAEAEKITREAAR
jgi:hypothetical protein